MKRDIPHLAHESQRWPILSSLIVMLRTTRWLVGRKAVEEKFVIHLSLCNIRFHSLSLSDLHLVPPEGIEHKYDTDNDTDG